MPRLLDKSSPNYESRPSHLALNDFSPATSREPTKLLTENGYLDAGEISYEVLARKLSVTQATAVS